MEKRLKIFYAGVGKSEVAYKTGRTTEDVTLEILNLNSTEVVSIDTVSNQEFTEVIELLVSVWM